MSAADEDTELRDLLVQTLDKNGVLGKIKAELRASIFLALEAQEQNKTQNPLRNSKLQKFISNDEGRTCFSIVNEFLNHFNLDYTLAVFSPEANVNESIPSEDDVRESLNISKGSQRVPLLTEILRGANVNTTEKLADHQIQFLRSKFESFDRDGSGSIDRKDVMAVISLACPLFNQDMLERFVAEELRNQYSSSVTFDIFINIFRRLHEMCQSVTSVGNQTPKPSIPLTQTMVKSPEKTSPPDSYFMKQNQAFHQVPASPTPMADSEDTQTNEQEGVPASYLMPSQSPPHEGSMDVGYDEFFDSKPEKRPDTGSSRARTADSGYDGMTTNQMSLLGDAQPIAPGSASSSMTADDWPDKKIKTDYVSGSQAYEDDFNSEQSISEEIQDESNMIDDLLQSSDKDVSLDLTEDRTVSEVPNADYMEDVRHG